MLEELTVVRVLLKKLQLELQLYSFIQVWFIMARVLSKISKKN